MSATKICSGCNEEKSYRNFHKSKNSSDGYRFKCRVCINLKRRNTLLKKKNEGFIPTYIKIGLSLSDDLVGVSRQKAYHKEYRLLYKEKIKLKKQQDLIDAKLEGIARYGGKCSCCGELEIEFLTLEHLYGRELNDSKTGKAAWLKVKREKFPDKYTVLCFNCNCAKGIHGSCPHTWSKDV